MTNLPRISEDSDTRVYRGFRVDPCFVSPTSHRPCNTQQGWQSADINCGYISSLGRKTWFSNLERFVKRVDEMYVRAAEGNLTSENVPDLRAAITRLPYADHREHALAALEAGLAKEAAREAAEAAERAARAAEHQARKRLNDAAPALLEALQALLPHVPGYLSDDTSGRPWIDHARAAISQATGN